MSNQKQAIAVAAAVAAAAAAVRHHPPPCLIIFWVTWRNSSNRCDCGQVLCVRVLVVCRHLPCRQSWWKHHQLADECYMLLHRCRIWLAPATTMISSTAPGHHQQHQRVKKKKITFLIFPIVFSLRCFVSVCCYPQGDLTIFFFFGFLGISDDSIGGSKRLTCKFCGRRFSQKGNLNAHVKLR